jgi:rhodanese-related sulfurtransferase
MKKNFLIINVLDTQSYDDCHIKGSINVPLSRLDDFAKKLDRTTEIVVYCANYMCPISKKAWYILNALGFTNVKAYEGGIREWFQLGLPCEGTCTDPHLKDQTQKPSQDPKVITISAQELAAKIKNVS